MNKEQLKELKNALAENHKEFEEEELHVELYRDGYIILNADCHINYPSSDRQIELLMWTKNWILENYPDTNLKHIFIAGYCVDL